MPVQGRHPSQYAWRPRRPPDTVPDLGRFAGVHATGVKPAGAGGEPGALTVHARFWEGPGVNWTWIKYCDTTRGNGWTTGKTNRILNPRDPGLLTRSRGYGPRKWWVDRPRPGQHCRSAADISPRRAECDMDTEPMSVTVQAIAQKPRSRWLQYSWRTLQVLVLVIVCGLGWLAVRRGTDLGVLRRLVTDDSGSAIVTETEFAAVGYNIDEVDDADMVHLRSLPDLRKLRLNGTKITDEGLAQVPGLRMLSVLQLNGLRITDAGLVLLKRLPRLEELELGGTQITDAGLENFGGLTHLNSLNLNSTQVTGVGFKHLHGLPRLECLYLSGSPVTDAGMEHLGGLTQLRHLDLDATRVTDAGLVHLHGLTQLNRLSLRNTQVTDAGLQHFGGLTEIRHLELDNTRITDAGLGHLQRLKQLLALDLDGTQVTEAGAKNLQTALPDVIIRGLTKKAD